MITRSGSALAYSAIRSDCNDSASSVQVCAMNGSISATLRGVKARCMRLRSAVCSGGSLATSIRGRGKPRRANASAEENVAVSRSTASTSS